jgi:hypothetical protein
VFTACWAIAGDLAGRRALLERAEDWAELAGVKLDIRLSLCERVLEEAIAVRRNA